MYVDLLTRALGKGEEGRRSDDLLLADLVHSRARLRATEGDTRTPVAEALARELSYDGALIRLCASLDVPTGPACFANPVRERTRLERELTARGLDLSDRTPGAARLARHGAVAVASAVAVEARATLRARMSTFELNGPAMTSQSGASSAQWAADRFGATTTTGVSAACASRARATFSQSGSRRSSALTTASASSTRGQWPVADRAHSGEKPPCGPGHHVMR